MIELLMAFACAIAAFIVSRMIYEIADQQRMNFTRHVGLIISDLFFVL